MYRLKDRFLEEDVLRIIRKHSFLRRFELVMIKSKKIRTFLHLNLLIIILFLSGHSLSSTNSNGTLEKNEIQSNCISYLIITTKSFVDNVEPLATWKTQKGLISKIITIEDIDREYTGFDRAEKIRNCIKQYYNNNNTKWVVLAGGESKIPSRAVSVDNALVYCDYYYSNLDNNWLVNTNGVASIIDVLDWDAEVYVGRLPAERASQMNELVAKILNYEKNPPIGPWMKHALFAGTFANFDSDENSNNIFDEGDYEGFDTNRNHNWLKENILPANWTSTLLAEREGIVVTSYPYDESISTSSFINEINYGASIIMADAHGSPFGMTRTIFSNDVDQDGLFDYGVDSYTPKSFLSISSEFNTDGKNGFFWLAACSTGTFTEDVCLSEYLVRNCGIGCIASYGSSYYDPLWFNGTHLGWFTQGLSTRFWEQLLEQGINQPGMAFSLAKTDYVADHIALDGPDTEGRTLTQYNLMGDPEIPIWTDIPQAIEPEIEMNETTGIVTVRALAGELPLPNVTVTLTGASYYYNVTTNELGEATLLLPNLEESEDITITFSKKQLLPYQELLTSHANLSGSINFIIAIIYVPFIASFVIIILIRLKRA